MRGHQLFADPFTQVQRYSLRQPPRIHEHQRGSMLQRQRRDAVVNLSPHFIGCNGTKLGSWHFYGQIERTAMPDVYHCGGGTSCASQKMRHQLNRLLRRRQSNAGRLTREHVQTFQRKRQVCSPLVVGDRMNLIHDHRSHVSQNLPALFRSQQNVKRLRRSHEDVRRTLQHLASFFGQRVACAHCGADFRHQHPAFRCQRENLAQRTFEIFLDVIPQRLERRDIQNLSPIHQVAFERLAHQPINTNQKCRQRFARTCRS